MKRRRRWLVGGCAASVTALATIMGCGETPGPSRDGVPTQIRGYAAAFSSPDRRVRCVTGPVSAHCDSTPKRLAATLRSGGEARVTHVFTSTPEHGQPVLAYGRTLKTSSLKIECNASTRGITCIDNVTGSFFMINSKEVVAVNRPGRHGGHLHPSQYAGHFMDVDRRVGCFLRQREVSCTAAHSGQQLRLVVGMKPVVVPLKTRAAFYGLTIPIGGRIYAPGGTLECAVLRPFTIRCRDNGSGEHFTISDRAG